MKTSCIIPAFNEESTVACVIENVRKVRIIDEIIVVDDGSTDATSQNAMLEGVKVIRHARNKGKGAALKTGIANCQGDIIIFIDADITSFDSSPLVSMIQLLKSRKADVVIATYSFHCYQTFTEVIYKPLMGLFFPEVLSKIREGHLSGQRGFRREVLEKLHLSNGFEVESLMNIELTFMQPSPQIAFVHLGDLKLRAKGYQKAMEKISSSIISQAKKYKRVDRLKTSSFLACSRLLYTSVKEAL